MNVKGVFTSLLQFLSSVMDDQQPGGAVAGRDFGRPFDIARGWSNKLPTKLPTMDELSEMAATITFPDILDGSSTLAATTMPPPDSSTAGDGRALIPRSVLFGQDMRGSVQLSPDGKWIAYVAESNGVDNIYLVKTVDAKAGRPFGKPITDVGGRGVIGFGWTYTEDMLYYTVDETGAENYKLYTLNVAGVADGRGALATYVVGGDDVQPRLYAISQNHPKVMLIAVNDRNGEYHDAYAYDLLSKQRTLVFRNDGFLGLIFDNDFKLRLGMKVESNGDALYYKNIAPSSMLAEWQLYAIVPFEENEMTVPICFDKSDELVYWLNAQGSDLEQPSKKRVKRTARLEVKSISEPFDVTGQVLYEPKRAAIMPLLRRSDYALIGVYEVYDRPNLTLFDTSLEPHMKKVGVIDTPDNMQVELISTTVDFRSWIVSKQPADGVSHYYLYNSTTGEEYDLFASSDALAQLQLPPVRPVEVTSRDGLVQLCYVALPKQELPVPLVLNVHGGPWARTDWSFDPEVAFLADRGYAVLSCNFRGSSGFGKAHLNAGNGQWAAAMHDDVLDAADWAVKQGITKNDTIAVYGGSYGGYEALVAATFTPDRFACNVDIVGPSNLNTLLETVPPYWKPMRDQFKRRLGADFDAEAGISFLKERSPLFKADQVRKPLLIAQGANDPRVKRAESDQFVAALQANDIPVTYLLYPDEGHGFVRLPNQLSFYAHAERFLANCLGGRAQPFGTDLNESSVQVLVDAQLR